MTARRPGGGEKRKHIRVPSFALVVVRHSWVARANAYPRTYVLSARRSYSYSIFRSTRALSLPLASCELSHLGTCNTLCPCNHLSSLLAAALPRLSPAISPSLTLLRPVDPPPSTSAILPDHGGRAPSLHTRSVHTLRNR